MDIGSTLKKARVLNKLTLADVEEATKIRVKYLEAMEANNFSILPPGMYGSAFLRTYARFLGLNADELVSGYRELTGLSQPVVEEESPYTEVRPGRAGRKVWGSLAALVILAAAVGLFNHHSPFNPSAKSPPPAQSGSTAQSQPPPAQPAGSQDVAVSSLNLVLRATSDYSWFSVTVDGGLPAQGFIYAGQEKDFQGTRNINITLGNAGSVKVLVNGQDYGYLGGSGTVIQHTFASQGG